MYYCSNPRRKYGTITESRMHERRSPHNELHPPQTSQRAHLTYAARRRCDSLECSTIISVSSASGAAPSPPAERAATFLSAGSGALDNG